jgi:hypothetical protein
MAKLSKKSATKVPFFFNLLLISLLFRLFFVVLISNCYLFLVCFKVEDAPVVVSPAKSGKKGIHSLLKFAALLFCFDFFV